MPGTRAGSTEIRLQSSGIRSQVSEWIAHVGAQWATLGAIWRHFPGSLHLGVSTFAVTDPLLWPLAVWPCRHGRVTLDLSTPVLYSNLPNRVKLEALKREEAGHLTAPAGPVLVALQLPDGQRVLHEHPPSTSLWDVIMKAFP